MVKFIILCLVGEFVQAQPEASPIRADSLDSPLQRPDVPGPRDDPDNPSSDTGHDPRPKAVEKPGPKPPIEWDPMHASKRLDFQAVSLDTIATQQDNFHINLFKATSKITILGYEAMHAVLHVRVLESYIAVIAKALQQHGTLHHAHNKYKQLLKNTIHDVGAVIGAAASGG